MYDAMRVPASFRDPNGFVLFNNEEKKIQRIIFPTYFSQYTHLIKSGLYEALCKDKKLIAHHVKHESENKILIEPEEIPFISYSYEWPFHLLKEAALLTLDIAKKALAFGMCLKDASSFNIQLMHGKPIFIDTLSFEHYKENMPWGAYGQFCRHFLAPLLLMKYKSLNFSKLLSNFLDGFPIDFTSDLLPFRTRFSPSIQLNIHQHAKSLKKYTNKVKQVKAKNSLSKSSFFGLLTYLENCIASLNYLEKSTEWSNYYQNVNYSDEAFQRKEQIVLQWIETINANNIWDAGGNNGHFSRLIKVGKELIVSSDIDPIAVDQNFLINRKENISIILPLIVDITNPTPGIGFANHERTAFSERIFQKKLDCTLALALIHHLCISNNCTFNMISNYFKKMSKFLIIEFISPEDSWVQELLASKRDSRHLFDFYNQENFEHAFVNEYIIEDKIRINDTYRTLYLLKSRDYLDTL